MSNANHGTLARHHKLLFWASFFTLIAAGTSFAIRGKILGDWSTQFGYTMTELGTITGGGLIGFGYIILISSLFVDRIGYKPLMILAFVLHLASAGITVAATPVYKSTYDSALAASQSGGDVDAASDEDKAAAQKQAKDAAYHYLFWGTFILAVANGLCEAVINPLTANLFPEQKTHYLNILHAGWPGGLIVGGVLAFCFAGDQAIITSLPWERMVMMFIPFVLFYGFVMVKEKFPVPEVRAAGVSFGTMLLEFASPILLLLLVLHAMVGYVELGTDSWVTNIMENVVAGNAILVLIYTSMLMFGLRFFAGPIVEKINPVGLLFVSALVGAAGLFLLGTTTTAFTVFLAATVYGLGKAFYWPTMLGVVGEQFPKGGALTMGAIGGVGMLSAGYLGGPGIGYQQDLFSSRDLEKANPAVYAEYRSPDENSFLFFAPVQGLDGTKVGEIEDEKQKIVDLEKKEKETGQTEPIPKLTADQQLVLDAKFEGGQMALKWTAVVPLMMAVGYLILLIYYRAKGGYKMEVLHGAPPDGEHYTGGMEGPIE